MISLPDPLHPARGHFPIAFIVPGAALAALAVFVRRASIPGFATDVLTPGLIRSSIAQETGQYGGCLVDEPGAEMSLSGSLPWTELP